MFVQFDSELNTIGRKSLWKTFLNKILRLDLNYQPIITEITSIATLETDTDLVLKPDGTGSVEWGAGSGGAFSTISNITSNSIGTIGSDSFVFGSSSLDHIGGGSTYSRFLFHKDIGAFRAGTVTGTNWDYANCGENSVSFGLNSIASGDNSVAIQRNASATGTYAIAIGYNSSATLNSTSLGYGTVSEQAGSLALGYNSNAKGYYSSAMGTLATAGSFGEIVVGYNNTKVTGTLNARIATDRLFVIGNGTNTTPSDAFVMLKNGNTFLPGLKSGVDQASAGALVNELWVDTNDNSVKRGV